MAEYIRSLLTKKVLTTEPPPELWTALERLYSVHDMLLRIGKPEFTEASKALEEEIVSLQAAFSKPKEVPS